MPCFFRLCRIFFFRFCHIFYLFRPQKPRLGFAASTTSHCTFEALPPPYLVQILTPWALTGRNQPQSQEFPQFPRFGWRLWLGGCWFGAAALCPSSPFPWKNTLQMEQSRETQPAQWEGWECLEKNPCFGMQVQLWGSQSAGDIPGITLGWQHRSLGSSAPVFDPQIQGLQSFFPLLFQAFHFRGLVSPKFPLDSSNPPGSTPQKHPKSPNGHLWS